MRTLTLISAFLGGAIVGCGAALLFTPEKGADVRSRICELLRRRGIKISDSEVDALVAELAAAEA
ncbi:MAG: YtxH domain-containing protein [Muribaculaceae bacterium]|nr:YtxH domain-containing protein [Muribaculaceae bacterium]